MGNQFGKANIEIHQMYQKIELRRKVRKKTEIIKGLLKERFARQIKKANLLTRKRTASTDHQIHIQEPIQDSMSGEAQSSESSKRDDGHGQSLSSEPEDIKIRDTKGKEPTITIGSRISKGSRQPPSSSSSSA